MSSINISAMLGTSSSSSGSSASWLTDYMSIKSGSYGKLMKAYYGSGSKKTSGTGKSSASSSVLEKLVQEKKTAEASAKKAGESESTKAYNAVKASVSAVKSSMESVRKADSADADALYKAVSSFVKDYNDMQSAAVKTGDATVTNRMDSIAKTVKSQESALNSIGISIGSDGSLKLSEDTFKNADKTKVGDLFAEKGAFAKSVTTSADMMSGNASYAISRELLYGSSGNYASDMASAGTLFSTYT